MSIKRSLPGINIQYPISNLIIDGLKTVETRTYPVPEAYLDKEIFVVETPGKDGKFKARVIGIIKITKCFKYNSKTEFYKDFDRHQVSKNSPWAWKDKEKWGWEVKLIKKIPPILLTQRRGIVFTKEISI